MFLEIWYNGGPDSDQNLDRRLLYTKISIIQKEIESLERKLIGTSLAT